MPATTPQPPANFYPSDVATNKFYSLHFRVGYQHANHGNNNSTAWLSAKAAVNADQWRQQAGKNGWLVPDADAEFSHQDLAKKSSVWIQLFSSMVANCSPMPVKSITRQRSKSRRWNMISTGRPRCNRRRKRAFWNLSVISNNYLKKSKMRSPVTLSSIATHDERAVGCA